MLEVASAILYVFTWVSSIVILIGFFTMRSAVKGTPRRYVAKTSLIILIVVGLIVEVIYRLVCVLLADSIYERGWHTAFAALVAALFTRLLYIILNEDDDDWFNATWKKLKRWVRNIRTARRLKPAYAV